MINADKKILVIDDEADICQLLQDILNDEGYKVTIADSAEAAKEQCNMERYDLALLDIWMPNQDGVSLLKEWRGSPTAPSQIIMMSGHATIDTAVEATRLGAYDFIEKPVSIAKLLLTINQALAKAKNHNTTFKSHYKIAPGIIGKSKHTQQLKEHINKTSKLNITTIIFGELGLNKKNIAEYIHKLSNFKDGPFVTCDTESTTTLEAGNTVFNCDDSLLSLDSVLDKSKDGSLFLNQIHLLNNNAQKELYNYLNNDNKTRIIVGTNQSLPDLVKLGQFDQRLFHQLNKAFMVVYPLRERKEDILELTNYYIDNIVNKHGLTYRRLSMGAQNNLLNYEWPGNLMELESLLFRVLTLSKETVINEELVEQQLNQSYHEWVNQSSTTTILKQYNLPLREAREQFERDYLLFQLKRCGGKVSDLAKQAGMERTHLYRKLRGLNIDTKDFLEKDDS